MVWLRIYLDGIRDVKIRLYNSQRQKYLEERGGLLLGEIEMRLIVSVASVNSFSIIWNFLQEGSSAMERGLLISEKTSWSIGGERERVCGWEKERERELLRYGWHRHINIRHILIFLLSLQTCSKFILSAKKQIAACTTKQRKNHFFSRLSLFFFERKNLFILMGTWILIHHQRSKTCLRA